MSRAATLPLEETQHICRYWLHRISHEWDVSYKLLSAGYLSIGWSALAGSGIERVVRSATNSQPFEALMSTTRRSRSGRAIRTSSERCRAR